MPEHLRALVVITVIAFTVFKLAERPLCSALDLTSAVYRRRRNLWFAVTFIAFFSGNFWIYFAATLVLLAVYARKDSNPFALYCLLLFTVPPFVVPIPSIGPFNYIYNLDHLRVLTLAMLLPMATRLFAQRHQRRSATRSADLVVLGYVALLLALTSAVSNWTGIIRSGLSLFTDIVVPFFVASRVMADRKNMREVFAFFFLACAILGALALVESTRGWLLYSALPGAMGQNWSFGSYMVRDGAGLRASGSAGHSIILGYIMVVGLMAGVYLQDWIRPRWMWITSMAVVAGALLVTFSRGPWVGAMVALTVGLGLGRGAQKRLVKLAVAAVFLLIVVSFTSMGPKLLSYLPFVGDVAADTVTYRQELFRVSILVWKQNFLLGAYNYMQNPLMEQMRQGEGIIDMVNSYLAVALSSGLVGVLLYVGFFVTSGLGVWRTYRRLTPGDSEGEVLGRVLLAALAGIMVTIATSSPIGAIPVVYFFIIGAGVCYARIYSVAPPTQAMVAAPSAASPFRQGLPRRLHPRRVLP